MIKDIFIIFTTPSLNGSCERPKIKENPQIVIQIINKLVKIGLIKVIKFWEVEVMYAAVVMSTYENRFPKGVESKLFLTSLI